MWICPKCKTDVEDPFDICWACGTSRDGVEDPAFDPETDSIVTKEDFERARAARATERTVTIGIYNSGVEAEMARNHLEAAGIPALVVGEDAALVDWLIRDSLGGIRLLVFEQDQDQARAILNPARERGRASDQADHEP
jgi:hypothetical protein